MSLEFINPKKIVLKKSGLLLSKLSSIESNILNLEEKPTNSSKKISKDIHPKKKNCQKMTENFMTSFRRGDVSTIQEAISVVKMLNYMLNYSSHMGFGVGSSDKEFVQISQFLIDFCRLYPKLIKLTLSSSSSSISTSNKKNKNKNTNEDIDTWKTCHFYVLQLLSSIMTFMISFQNRNALTISRGGVGVAPTPHP